ncbi:hypothetical protein ACKKBG_A27315 [Auxenochlorella protothecoides x Auxenochlorella symbiontica]
MVQGSLFSSTTPAPTAHGLRSCCLLPRSSKVFLKPLALATPLRGRAGFAARCRAPADDDFYEELAVAAEEGEEQIPGSYRDAMSKQTPLGRAVEDAVADLDALVLAEKEQQEKAAELLSKLGVSYHPNPSP